MPSDRAPDDTVAKCATMSVASASHSRPGAPNSSYDSNLPASLRELSFRAIRVL